MSRRESFLNQRPKERPRGTDRLDWVLENWKQSAWFGPNITWQGQHAARPARFAPFPAGLDPRVLSVLREIGFSQLYSHQAEAVHHALAGENTLLVTPTASGKSLAYQIPILERKARAPHSRALLLFPTKALSQDQLAVFRKFATPANWNSGGKPLGIFNYDGDTPPDTRRKVRSAGDIVLTNPDMLHSGILPHHTQWIRLFENLDFVVIDELHTYRGVFGSHFANVIRRLKRVCEFYGKKPQFLCASATIGNPGDLAQSLLEEPVRVIDQNGAPRGAKEFVFYNPPVLNPVSGQRRSSVKEAARLGGDLLSERIPTIFFCRSRNRVEILLRILRSRHPLLRSRIAAYRGGYLPSERRKIEARLREGDLLAVVATNALELGIDIGSLSASVSVGYPGSISSLWQQFGRAGRRQERSLSLMVASAGPMDQFLVTHPDYLLRGSPEMGLVHPDNELIFSDHIKCSAFELPFRPEERLGKNPDTADYLDYLAEHGVLRFTEKDYRWTSQVYPASDVSLRTASNENFVICDITDTGREKIIGELDYFAAPTQLHDKAIYLHGGQPYLVERLRWEDRQADVVRTQVDYYTDATEKVDIEVLEDESRGWLGPAEVFQGELALIIKAVLFKKIKWETGDNVGFGQIDTPEIEMHTQGGWLLFDSLRMNPPVEDSWLGLVLDGLAYCLHHVAPATILCDRSDISVRAEVRSATFRQPAIYFYDHIPGGMKLSYRLIENLSAVLLHARQVIEGCVCEQGCPGCVGPPGDEEYTGRKQAIVGLLVNLLAAGPE